MNPRLLSTATCTPSVVMGTRLAASVRLAPTDLWDGGCNHSDAVDHWEEHINGGVWVSR